MSKRWAEGIETGRLKCCRCQTVKPVAGFPRHPITGWNSWCSACHREYQRSRDNKRPTRTVHARLKHATIEYMMTEMLPETAPKSIGRMIAQIVNDAVAAHKKACAHIKVRPLASEFMPTQSGINWPSKQRLMGGR